MDDVFALGTVLDQPRGSLVDNEADPTAEVGRQTYFVILCLAFSFILVWIPEFFYAEDIYPAHFRANTMFKLGYQAYILGSVGIVYTLFRLSHQRELIQIP